MKWQLFTILPHLRRFENHANAWFLPDCRTAGAEKVWKVPEERNYGRIKIGEYFINNCYLAYYRTYGALKITGLAGFYQIAAPLVLKSSESSRGTELW